MAEYELSRIDPISTGKISAALYAVMGLLTVLIYAPFLLVFLALDTSAAAIAGGLIMAVIFAVMGIVIYGIMGFVIGAFVAYFYNFLAGRMGGVKFEFEEK